MAEGKPEEVHVLEEIRKLIKLGDYSKAITLPRKWVLFKEWLRKEKLNEAALLADDMIIIVPTEEKEEYKKFLEVWSKLTPGERKMLLKLAKAGLVK